MAANGISTVMMKGIFDEMAEGHQLPKRVAQDLLSSMVKKVTQHLRQGDRIRIAGLGTLEVRKREARTGRNPTTGETIQIAASRKIAFRPAKELKETVQV
jgi:DNA-binding protein HU-beta